MLFQLDAFEERNDLPPLVEFYLLALIVLAAGAEFVALVVLLEGKPATSWEKTVVLTGVIMLFSPAINRAAGPRAKAIGTAYPWTILVVFAGVLMFVVGTTVASTVGVRLGPVIAVLVAIYVFGSITAVGSYMSFKVLKRDLRRRPPAGD